MNYSYTLSVRVPCLILICVHLFIMQTQCAHIVGFASLNYVSHHRMLWKLGKELQTRGHKYSHILPNFAQETFDDVNVVMFNSSVTNKDNMALCLRYASAGNFGKDLSRLFEGVTTIASEIQRIHRQACEDFLKHGSLISELKSSVDLVLCDNTNQCCHILADMLNVSRVDVSILGFFNLFGVYLSDYPQASVYVTLGASIHLPSESKFSFMNRLKGFVTCVCFWNILTYYNSRIEDLWEKYGKANSKFPSSTIARRTHGIELVPHDFALEQSRPLGANIKVIGALLSEPARRLPEHLDKFMNENKVVVIVSFGTIYSNYPPGLAQTIADELSQVRTAVLWKYSGEMPKNIGKNIKIIQWFSKNEFSFNDLLGHSSTKVFVTHGGLNSYQESVYHGVPMVVIPMMADQYRQADLIQHKGLGVVIQWTDIIANRKILGDAINEVLSNKLYVENVKGLSTIMKDRKQSPSQEGADWIEYALRHDGASFLTSEAIDLPQYKLHMFDVFIFLILVVCLIVYLLLRLCYCLLGACAKRMQVKKKQA